MNSRRTVIIGAAIMLALLAFLGNVLYLKNVQDGAYGKAKLVDVYVVKKTIEKGVTGEQALNQNFVRLDQIPQEFRPGTALNRNNINDIKNKVAVNKLSPGQVVVDGQFVDPNVAQITFAQRVPPGQVAITASVDQVHGVAGLLVPGDKVNILVESKPQEGQTNARLEVLYQNVNILAIGAKAAPQAGDASQITTKDGQPIVADSGLITFAVPLEAAMRIGFFADGGNGGSSLYLTLVPPDNAAISPAPGVVDGGNAMKDLPPTPYPNNG